MCSALCFTSHPNRALNVSLPLPLDPKTHLGSAFLKPLGPILYQGPSLLRLPDVEIAGVHILVRRLRLQRLRI